jgi:outer membrane protein OmpA-like peptidoglycan-associated protein
MSSKASLVLLMSGVYFLFATWLYNNISPACQPAEIETPLPKLSEPLMFNWSNSEAMTNESFDDYKAKLLLGKAEDNIFEITGEYFKGEKTPTGFDNLGLVRGEEIRKLFSEIPNERIRIKSVLAKDKEGMKSNSFISASFKWIAPPEKLAPVIELGNQALIYFEFNSAVGKIDPKVEEYLKKLADILKTSDETVTITGHTDDNGTPEDNNNLGLRRAQAIQNLLLKNGVPPAKIKAVSKGESEPASSNATDAGQASNRRTVIQRIK